MQFIDGVDLEKYLTKLEGKKLSWVRILCIARDIASAMAYIHDRNILHLDLRCSNVLVIIYSYQIQFNPSIADIIPSSLASFVV